MTRPQTCSRCDQEVRYGVRRDVKGWHHREDVDHAPRFGTPAPPLSEMMAARAASRAVDVDEDTGEDKVDKHIIPDPEVYATEIELGDERLAGGSKAVVKLAAAHGWEIRTTYSRGPWMHSSGDRYTSICNLVRVRMLHRERGMLLSASWRDGKFESAWDWSPRRESDAQLSAAALKSMIKTPPPEEST